MIWTTVLTILGAAVLGAGAFALVMLVKPHSLILSGLSVIALAVGSPYLMIGPIFGAWLAKAYFLRSQEGMSAPNEALRWRKIIEDVAGVSAAYVTGLLLMYRTRTDVSPGVAVGAGLSLALVLVILYFSAAAGQIPKPIRAKHGYLVGLASSLPWLLMLIRLGWELGILGFFTFVFLPPFLLNALDFKLVYKPLRRYRPRRSSIGTGRPLHRARRRTLG